MPPIPKTPKEILAEFETKIMGNDLAFGTKEGTLNLLRGLFISLLLEAKGRMPKLEGQCCESQDTLSDVHTTLDALITEVKES